MMIRFAFQIFFCSKKTVNISNCSQTIEELNDEPANTPDSDSDEDEDTKTMTMTTTMMMMMMMMMMMTTTTTIVLTTIVHRLIHSTFMKTKEYITNM